MITSDLSGGASLLDRRLERRAGGSGKGPWTNAFFASALALSVLLFAHSTWRFLASGDAGGSSFSLFLRATFGVAMFFMGARWTVCFVLSFLSRRPASADDDRGPWPFVSILVPAYNEASTIGPALSSLTSLDYPAYEVIVVDDGSRDATCERALRFEGRHARCTVRCYTKPNGGKWSAHNFAFHRSRGELLLCVDADSRLDPSALKLLVARLRDPRVAAVAGQVRVRNRVNLLTRLQALEYIVCNGLLRMAQSLSGTVLVVPGPIGLFRRAVLEEVFIRFGASGEGDGAASAGPFEGDTFAEDFDLSLAILSLGGRVSYEPRAISRTKAPATAFALLSQRYRWVRGSCQVVRKLLRRAKDDPAILSPRILAWLAVTYFVELTLLPLVNMGAFLFLAGSLASGVEGTALACWLMSFFLLSALGGAYFAAVHGERLRILRVLPAYDIYHIVLLNCGWVVSLFDEARGRRMRW